MKGKQWLCCILAAVLILTGCSAKAEMDSAPMEEMREDAYYGAVYDSANGSAETQSAAGTSAADSAGIRNQKLIRTMTVDAETDDMDLLLAQLDERIRELGGYVESKSMRNGSKSATRSYRYADLTIRIPVERLDEFIEHVKDQTNVVQYYEHADDITLSYVATQSRITALETEQTRLLELLAKAENMSDLLQIEQRLTDVRTELEEVTSQLRLYDNLVDYGTIELSITEVQEYTVVEEETVWQRIAGGLKDNWEKLCDGLTELFIFLVVSLPYLIPVGAAAAITWIAVKLAMKKTKKQDKEPPKPSEDA